MATPHIKTAIPKRRYQYGEFLITVLGDVDTDEPLEYRWIFAVATEANPQPGLFITAERPANTGEPYRMRVAMADGSQELGESEGYRDLDTFVDEALGVAKSMLNLSDEEPHRLL